MVAAVNAKLKSLDLRLMWAIESPWEGHPILGGCLHFKLSLVQGGRWVWGDLSLLLGPSRVAGPRGEVCVCLGVPPGSWFPFFIPDFPSTNPFVS